MSARISPTAHYTGYVWARNGIGPRDLATREGAVLYGAARPVVTAARLAGGPSLEGLLLARHRIIDHVLSSAVAAGEVGSVVEIAAGMSPRGVAFAARFPSLTYVETDLPDMAAAKQARLGSLAANHRVVPLDALSPDGLAAVCAGLDHKRGLAVITEGLLNYLPTTAVEGLWHRVAAVGRTFPTARYLSDLHVRDANSGRLEKAFVAALGVFVRGRIHLHYRDVPEAEQALWAAGFDDVTVHRPADFASVVDGVGSRSVDAVRIVNASV